MILRNDDMTSYSSFIHLLFEKSLLEGIKMGECLSKPATEKHTTTFETDEVRLAVSGMQGWRKSMEDAHTLEYQVDKDRTKIIAAVFDGHNTAAVSKFCGENLPVILRERKEFKEKMYKEAMEESFLQLDKMVREDGCGDDGGCTACAVLIAEGSVYCANAGDSRAVMCRGGKAFPLSDDHKASDLTEAERIESAGGTIIRGRVGGTLAVARAMGDFDYKDPTKDPRKTIVTAFPDVSTSQLSRDVDFIVVACDGVWDMLSNDEVCAIVAKELKETDNDLGLVCERVMDHCLAPTAHGYGTDNMTIAIIQPKPALLGLDNRSPTPLGNSCRSSPPSMSSSMNRSLHKINDK